MKRIIGVFSRALRNIFCLLLGIGFAVSCTMPERSDEERRLVRDEINQRQIKRVTESELFNEVRQRGNAALKEINHTLMAEIADNDSIDISEVLYSFCDSINNSGQSVRFYLTHSFNPNTQMDKESLGMELVSAYLYSDSLGLEMQENIQRQGRDSLIYMSPVIRNSDLGKVIFDQHTERSGLNTLAGVWELKFAVKEIVLGIDQD